MFTSVGTLLIVFVTARLPLLKFNSPPWQIDFYRMLFNYEPYRTGMVHNMTTEHILKNVNDIKIIDELYLSLIHI